MKASIKTRIAKGGETIACAFLAARGYSILENNWRSGRFGEIDIIASSPEGLIVFVEVKTRRQKKTTVGIPESGFDAVNRRKQRKIARTASSYLAGKGFSGAPARFDTIVISLSSAESQDPGEKHLNIVHVPEAFVG